MLTRTFGLVGLLVLLGLALFNAPHTRAAPHAVFTVTTTNDANDGVCDAAHCSLREAINAANSSGAAGVIDFNIIGFPPFVIEPGSPLPAVTQNGINIDGYSQLGAIQNTDPSISNANLMIELSGAAAGAASGLELAGGNSSVRGLVIYHWSGTAVVLTSSFNTVAGNFIGIGTDGVTGLTNLEGVYLGDATTSNVIGGEIAAERNVIGYNSFNGVYASGSGHSIVKNLVGVSAGGALAVPNGNGIQLRANNVEIRSNVISGNSGYGVWLDGGARKNTITSNIIGADATLAAALPNSSDGILLNNAVKKNRIGGNMITNNGGAGIALTPNAGAGNNLGGNWIFDNTLLGIDLNQDGITPNDKFDADGGPNLLQNMPEITSAESTPQRVRGRIKTASNVTVTLDFYANNTCDLSGFGEGLFYLGSTTVTTNAKGKAAFNWIATSPFATGQSITATATVKKSTSEFSACALALPG
ncbi:MAG: right-handed parallel beta-helix repeat-containing protein [Chloroflexi bacterium]|nr:right-handed parallel beta-helix repeat-containing protein [Chloroflexota bacterium]